MTGGPHDAVDLKLATQPEGASGAVTPALIARADTVLELDSERGRWSEAATPFAAIGGEVTAIAPDGAGAWWLAVRVGNRSTGLSTSFYRYTANPPRAVFSEVPSPAQSADGNLVSLDAQPDGTVWTATDEGILFRYDRLTGWERAPIPGWDPGRVVTRRSDIHAVAVNASGVGVAVGERGRIADIEPDSVSLDRAAGTLCDLSAPVAPCGTGRDLDAAAVAPDGSAIVAGSGRIGAEGLALLWRPAGGEFRSIAKPEAAPTSEINGISMPSPERAWIVTDRGLVFGGRLVGENWSWSAEALDARQTPLSFDALGEPAALSAVAIDASGHGYVVGERGLVLERSTTGAWRRLEVPSGDDLWSVSLAEGGGPGALIGAANGAVLTLRGGEFQIARQPAPFRADWAPVDEVVSTDGFAIDPPPPFAHANSGSRSAPIVSVALAPGLAAGETEAWALARGGQTRPGTSQLLHHASDPAEPLLDPAADAAALADAPAPRPGELAFASFGFSRESANSLLAAPASRVAEAIAERAEAPGGPSFTLFSGDISRHGGETASAPLHELERRHPRTLPKTADQAPRAMWRFRERIFERLDEAGAPVFGAIGARDLSVTRIAGTSVTTEDYVKAGENLVWRQAMAERPWPAGDSDTLLETDALSFEALGDSGLAVRHEEQELDLGELDGEGGVYATEKAPTGGASTHYAVDVMRDGDAAARIVVADTSPRSLSAADPIQQPLEGKGGQSAWLEEMLCYEGQTTTNATGECTRQPSQEAIVLTNTPTYDYASGRIDETQLDSAAFEATLLRYDADLVVTGRLGYNGRYWTTAPGLHEPCPGSGYQPDEATPQPGTRVCDRTAAVPAQGADRVPAEATALANQANPDGLVTGLIPFVVAANSGGDFPSGADASGGDWRGYQLVRLSPDGDPTKTIVEQRPVFDWIALAGQKRVLGPRERLRLEGTGREPIALPSGDDPLGVRFDRIDSAAITHRYELLLADPEEPWLACSESDAGCLKLKAGIERAGGGEASAESACAPYLCLPAHVGKIDSQSGEVRAGDGRYPETFAIALLSVGEQAATYPLVFRRSPSFVVKTALRTPQAPKLNNVPTPRPPGPPSIPEPPSVPQIEVPTIPAPPGVPPLTAAAPPELTPPAPPAPPPPSQQPTPLDLSVAPPGVSISTPTALIQPPTPPVNPAPPGGARREARQRQAAAQKGGADSGEDARSKGMDLADSPPGPDGAEMTRLDHSFSRLGGAHRARPEPSFTAYRPAGDGSPLGTGVLYASGIALFSFALATGWRHGRPGRRQRTPEVPAPARSIARVQRR